MMGLTKTRRASFQFGMLQRLGCAPTPRILLMGHQLPRPRRAQVQIC